MSQIAPPDEYIPGICNIGKHERANRLRGFFIFFGLVVCLIFVFTAFMVELLFQGIIAIPIFLTFVSFFQWKWSFCVYFGLKSVSKMGKKSEKIDDEGSIKLDQRRIIKNFVISGFLAVVTTTLYLLTQI